MSQRIFSASDFQDPPARGRGSRSGAGSVVARIVAALIGLIVTAPALLLVMVGGSRAYAQTLVQARTEPAVDAILLAGAGLVLVMVVVLSGLLSALGPLLAGAVATGMAVAFLADPGLLLSASRSIPWLGADSSITITFWWQSGLLLVVGVVLLASSLARAIAARSRANGRGVARAVTSIIVAVVASTGGLALVVSGASALLRVAGTVAGAGSIDVPSLLMLVAGAVVLGGVALTTAWSSVGAAIAGSVLLVVGAAGFLPVVVLGVFDVFGWASSDVAGTASTVLAVGFVAVVGVLLLGAAASTARARRAGR
jgi:hypothetical protein